MTPTPSYLVTLPRSRRAAILYDLCAYAALVAAGHSPLKATTIVRNATRGDRYSLEWLAGIGILHRERCI